MEGNGVTEIHIQNLTNLCRICDTHKTRTQDTHKNVFTGKSTPTKTAVLVQEKSRLRRVEDPKNLNGEEGNIPQRLWMIPVRTPLVVQKQSRQF